MRVSMTSLSGGAFVLYASVSLLWSSDPTSGGLWLLTMLLAFAAGAVMNDLRSFWFGYCIVLCGNGVLVLWFYYGLLGNSNIMGCAVALGLAASFAYRDYWFQFLGWPMLLYTQSRTAITAAVAAALIAIPRSYRLYAVLALIPAAVLVYALRGAAPDSTLQRLGIWQDTLDHLTFFGRGAGSFFEAYYAFPVKRNMTLVIAPHAYNDYLELIFEFGIGAALLWPVLFGLLSNRENECWLICITFLVMSLTFFPLFVPVLGHAFALALGHLARGVYTFSPYPQRSFP